MSDIINVKEVVGSSLCTSTEEGNKIFKLLKESIEKNEKITVVFCDVSALTSDFVSAAIGQLYAYFDEDKLRHIKYHSYDCDYLLLIKRVIESSKKHFKNKTKTGE